MILGFCWGGVGASRNVLKDPLPPHNDAARPIASADDCGERKLILHFQPCSIHPGS